MACISRVADLKTVQRFGDGKRRFFLEYRCNNPCIPDSDICEKCIVKEDNYPNPHLRRFNHGKVCDPIPDNSHIYGGRWYFEGVKKWGAPSQDIIEFALECQREAQKGFTVEQEVYNSETYKEEERSIVKIMPPRKKKVEEDKPVAATEEVKPKRGRKKVAVEENVEKTETPVKKRATGAKKQEVKELTKEHEPLVEPGQDKDVVVPKRKRAAPKKKPTNVKAVVETPEPESDAIIPALIEETIEEFDTDDFDVEYVAVELFELDGSKYIRDPNKNKLYKCLKNNKIGDYIGRYNPDTSEIDYEVPDSDCE
jgi:hypothetical protein